MSTKKPRLFYWEEGVGAWTPAPDKVENIIEATSHFSGPEDDPVKIVFRRFDMTDEEFAALPDE